MRTNPHANVISTFTDDSAHPKRISRYRLMSVWKVSMHEEETKKKKKKKRKGKEKRLDF